MAIDDDKVASPEPRDARLLGGCACAKERPNGAGPVGAAGNAGAAATAPLDVMLRRRSSLAKSKSTVHAKAAPSFALATAQQKAASVNSLSRSRSECTERLCKTRAAAGETAQPAQHRHNRVMRYIYVINVVIGLFSSKRKVVMSLDEHAKPSSRQPTCTHAAMHDWKTNIPLQQHCKFQI